jgi:uncharacterized protein (DUF608 family)
MKRRHLLAGAGLGAASGLLDISSLARTANAARPGRRPHPAVKEVMRHADRARSGVMLGGIGAGGAELRKDGRFCNWSAFNNSPRGTGPNLPGGEDAFLFFKLRYEVPGQEPRIKLLQIEGWHEVGTVTVHVYEFPWMSGVEKIEYAARFPFADLTFTDPEMPVDVTLSASSPFVPHDVDASSLPAMLFDFTVTNRSSKPVDVMLMACQRNLVGYDFAKKLYQARVTTEGDFKLIEVTSTGVPEKHTSAGTMALASLSPDTTHYAGWEHRHPYFERVLRGKTLGNIDETEKRTRRDRKTNERWALPRVFNTLARSVNLGPKKSFQHRFVATWFFPNMYNEDGSRIEGVYYARNFKSAGEVARHVIKNHESLTTRTRRFVDDLYASDLEPFVLDQINSQLNTFITSTWLTKDGNFGVIEGMTPDQKWGPLATTDVSVYGSIPIATLFPSLARATLRAHRGLQAPSGEIAHGLQRDFRKKLTGVAGVDRRLDLHAQYVGMVMRDFFWSGDKAFLEEMWPSIKKALDYCVKERDLNGDSMPDMEGIMSSYDNFPMFGTAAYIGSQWLAALRAATLAAGVLGDADAESRYGGYFDKGKTLFEERLWNGKYFRLWNDENGKHGGKDEGCLTDQLIGQWTMRFTGLGNIVPQERVVTALRSILEMSYRPSFGLRNCSWPGANPWMDVPDDIWVDQANTCWSGVELAFASFLMYEGLHKEALAVVKTVDDRYRKAGRYWDHQEFGGHYYRPMAAWGLVNAAVGLSINTGVYGFRPNVPRPALHLYFATPTATGHYDRKGSGAGERIEIAVGTGELSLRGLELAMSRPGPKASVRVDGAPVANARVEVIGKAVRFTFADPVTVRAGQKIEARA